MKLITFQVGHEIYGVPIEKVQSIESVQPIRKVPLSSKEILGVMNLRGVVTTVKDLNVILGITNSDSEITDNSRLILLDRTAYLVDAAENIIECSEEEIQAIDQIGNKHIQGVVRSEDKLVTLLNL